MRYFSKINVLVIKINYQFLSLFFALFAIGIYGYPYISLDHNSYIGLVLRTSQRAISYLIIGCWIVSILYFNKSNNWSKTIIKFTIRISDLIAVLIIFLFSSFLKQREYSSSITGDEITLYGSSLEASQAIFEKTIPSLSWLNNVSANTVIAFYQLVIVVLIAVIIKQLILTDSRYRLVLFFIILIVTHFMHNKYIGGSGPYPNLDVIPYFFLSPIQLFFNFSPKYISLLIFCIFLQIVFHISARIIHSKFLRIILISIIASLNVFIDTASSLNHGIYFIYFTSIFIFLYVSRKLEFIEMFSLVLIFSLFRPTLLVLIVFLLLNRNGFRIKLQLKFQPVSNFLFQLFKISAVQIIFVINVVIDAIYSYRDPKSKPSFMNHLENWINNLTNLDYQTAAIVFFGIVISIFLKKTYLYQIYLLSAILYLLMAPRGNLSGPQYKVEVITPILIAALSEIFVSLSRFFEGVKQRVHLNQYLSKFVLITFLFTVMLQMHNNDKTMKYPNYTWNPRYYSYEVSNNKLDGYRNSVSHISFGKVDYSNEILDFALINNCKFVDIVPNKSLFLKSGISSGAYLKIQDPIALGALTLDSLVSIKCVIVANYPLGLFLLENDEYDLEFKILRKFYDSQLRTSVFIFTRQ